LPNIFLGGDWPPLATPLVSRKQLLDDQVLLSVWSVCYKISTKGIQYCHLCKRTVTASPNKDCQQQRRMFSNRYHI